VIRHQLALRLHESLLLDTLPSFNGRRQTYAASTLSARTSSAVFASCCWAGATGSTTMDAIPDSTTSNDKVEAQISTSQVPETQVPPLSASRKNPLSDDEEIQVQKIINATETRDWDALGRLAASPGGFIDDEVRRIVCTC
jgi:hypothetical protein